MGICAVAPIATTEIKSCFSMINGREVYDNGQVRIWRCPDCRWWRKWEEKTCIACGTPREEGKKRNA